MWTYQKLPSCYNKCINEQDVFLAYTSPRTAVLREGQDEEKSLYGLHKIYQVADYSSELEDTAAKLA